jgi:hypothetical protein
VLKRRWQEAVAQLERARREGAGAFDQLWETVDQIVSHDPPLYLAGGIATAKGFIERFTGETVRTAQRLMRVARYASPDEENRYGVSKLDAAISYVEAKLGAPAKGRVPIDFAALRIEVERGGAQHRLTLDQATVQEVQAALRALGRKRRPAPKRASPAVRAIVDVLRRGSAPLRQVTVSLTHERFTLGNISASALPELGRQLARLKLPKPD